MVEAVLFYKIFISVNPTSNSSRFVTFLSSNHPLVNFLQLLHISLDNLVFFLESFELRTTSKNHGVNHGVATG